MTPIAVLFLVISITVVWGGLTASILHLRAHPTDELDDGADDDDAAGGPSGGASTGGTTTGPTRS